MSSLLLLLLLLPSSPLFAPPAFPFAPLSAPLFAFYSAFYSAAASATLSLELSSVAATKFSTHARGINQLTLSFRLGRGLGIVPMSVDLSPRLYQHALAQR